jgi:hypothetical protein
MDLNRIHLINDPRSVFCDHTNAGTETKTKEGCDHVLSGQGYGHLREQYKKNMGQRWNEC